MELEERFRSHGHDWSKWRSVNSQQYLTNFFETKKVLTVTLEVHLGFIQYRIKQEVDLTKEAWDEYLERLNGLSG